MATKATVPKNQSPTPPAPKPPATSVYAKQPGSPALTAGQQSALDLMTSTLASWGLSSLLPDVKKFILNGDTAPDTLALALSQTDAYKQRFAGNALRVKNGLSELTPAQYIGLEEQYQNVLRSYGMPSGFYDKPEDFTKFIAQDISPTELQERAKIAHDQYENAPDNVKALWGEYFGNKGDAIAAILDPQVATSVIQDRARQVQLGGAALQFGMHIGQSRAHQFDQAGVTLAGAQKAYQQIASVMPTDQDIAHRFGTQFTQTDEENDLLLGDAKAGVTRRNMYDEEESLFKGSSGLSQNALAVGQEH